MEKEREKKHKYYRVLVGRLLTGADVNPHLRLFIMRSAFVQKRKSKHRTEQGAQLPVYFRALFSWKTKQKKPKASGFYNSREPLVTGSLVYFRKTLIMTAPLKGREIAE